MTATINPNSIVQGPANLWFAPFGTTEPADSAVTSDPGAGWIFAGGTEDPVVLEEDLTYSKNKVTQVQMAVGARMTEYVVTVKTKLSEMTVQNLQYAMNQLNTVVVNSGYTTIDRQVGLASSQPTYAALIVDGWGPTLASGAARKRSIVRKVISMPKITQAYDPAKQAFYDVTFEAFYISPSIAPVHEILQTV
jgi:hypothetical protein